MKIVDIMHIDQGYHLWDPKAQWTKEAERKVIWIADLRLMSMLCLMFIGKRFILATTYKYVH